MPRFYFDVQSDEGLQEDHEGIELADIAEARKEAQKVLPDMAQDEIPAVGDKTAFTVLVLDENRQPLYSATLAYAGRWLAPKRS